MYKILEIFLTVIFLIIVLAISIVKFSLIISDISNDNEDDDKLTKSFRKHKK